MTKPGSKSGGGKSGGIVIKGPTGTGRPRTHIEKGNTQGPRGKVIEAINVPKPPVPKGDGNKK
jgi:hypothetical protein